MRRQDHRASRTGGSGRWELAAVFAVVLVVVVSGLSRLTTPTVEEGESVSVSDPDAVYDPVRAGEPLPEGYRPVTDRDRIRPIYEPRFVTADQARWSDDTLVLGVALEGEAKAYPVRVLNHREMVLDRLGGTPILSTW